MKLLTPILLLITFLFTPVGVVAAEGPENQNIIDFYEQVRTLRLEAQEEFFEFLDQHVSEDVLSEMKVIRHAEGFNLPEVNLSRGKTEYMREYRDAVRAIVYKKLDYKVQDIKPSEEAGKYDVSLKLTGAFFMKARPIQKGALDMDCRDVLSLDAEMKIKIEQTKCVAHVSVLMNL